MKSLNESIREVETKKRTLEETVDSLNEEITQRKAAEQMHKVNNTAQFLPRLSPI
jgi:prefoldin subunit 5